MDMYERAAKAVEEILSEPVQEYTKSEAIQMLYECGVLDKSGNVKPAYRGILVRRVGNNGSANS